MNIQARIIPTLLIKNRLAYVSRNFVNCEYVGDPINIINILSAHCADEVLIVDKSASVNGCIDKYYLGLLRSVADFPLSYAGGVRTNQHVDEVFTAGFDKLVLSACNHSLIKLAEFASNKYGAQAVALSIDYARNEELFTLYDPYQRMITSINLLDLLSVLPLDIISDIILTNVISTGQYTGINTDVLFHIDSLGIKNPILLSGGLRSLDISLFHSIIETFETFSGVCSSTGIFLQSNRFGSALVSLNRFKG